MLAWRMRYAADQRKQRQCPDSAVQRTHANHEQGRLGSRDTPIGYGRKCVIRRPSSAKSVKWDFELREPEQIATLIDRAYAIANSLPKGPVYLSLPREPLCEPYECVGPAAAPIIHATSYAPHPDTRRYGCGADRQGKEARHILTARRRICGGLPSSGPNWPIAGVSRWWSIGRSGSPSRITIRWRQAPTRTPGSGMPMSLSPRFLEPWMPPSSPARWKTACDPDRARPTVLRETGPQLSR